MKQWEIKNDLKIKDLGFKIDDLISLLLKNRGISTEKDREDFLHPRLEELTPKSVGIDGKQLKKTLARIQKAIAKKEQIVIFGDYDVDGITSSAILWETLHDLGASCVPYIPHRVEEGYGLSKLGIKNVQTQISNVSLIITVDNGIVAHDAVAFANEQGIDVIITDHHTPPSGGGETLPDAYAIVHTTKLCGAGVAFVLSKEIKKTCHPELVSRSQAKNEGMLKYPKGTSFFLSGAVQHDSGIQDDPHLELAALGTVADLVPLTGANRTIVTYGIPKLRSSRRIGLQALYRAARLDPDTIGVYEIGFIIGPRVNASGRIDSAMDSLRLLCTKSPARANELAANLEITNKERQLLLKETAAHAIDSFKKQKANLKNILVIAHEDYQEGIIGLVAGKLVEEFYRPSIVIAKGEKHSKASARSISGFNIIEFLRLHAEHFVNVGGHPMAAGFTIETEKIILLQEALEKKASEHLQKEHFVKKIAVDCEISLTVINQSLYMALHDLAPFGMKNPEPTFISRNVTIENIRLLGAEKKHVKFVLKQNGVAFDAIAFSMAEQAKDLKVGDTIDVVYTIDENRWNGSAMLQLKIKDFNTVS